MAAKQSKVSSLHDLLTELFIEDIKMCRAEGIPMSASDKAVIVKFLKDNNVSIWDSWVKPETAVYDTRMSAGIRDLAKKGIIKNY